MQTTPSGQDDLSLKVKVRSTPLKNTKNTITLVRIVDQIIFEL